LSRTKRDALYLIDLLDNTDVASAGKEYKSSPSLDTAMSPNVNAANLVKSRRACERETPALLATSEAIIILLFPLLRLLLLLFIEAAAMDSTAEMTD
jgi:hypothetical protein